MSGFAPTFALSSFTGYSAPYHGSAFGAPVYSSGFQYPFSAAQYPTQSFYSGHYSSPFAQYAQFPATASYAPQASFQGWPGFVSSGFAPTYTASPIAPTVTYGGHYSGTVSAVGAPRAPRRAPPAEPPAGYE